MKIAVVCAFNPDYNTGMSSVDLAAVEFFSGLHDTKVRYLVLADVDHIRAKPPELLEKYRPMHEEPDFPEGFDKIVFWGDFLHSLVYWKRDAIPRLVQQKIVKSTEEGMDMLHAFFMLEGQPDEIIRKVILFGGTILPDTGNSLENTRFRRNFERLLENAQCVMMRDPVSFERCHQVSTQNTYPGCDASLLFSWKERDKSPRLHGKSRLNLFIGRSGLISRLKFAILSTAFRVSFGYPTQWLQWLPGKRADRVFYSITSRQMCDGLDYHGVMNSLEDCDFVISDVYHMCLHSWMAGIPAICIGHGSKHEENPILSKKKEFFYYANYAQKKYFYWSEFSPLRFRKTLRRLQFELNDHAGNNAISHRIQTSSKRVYDQLKIQFE